MTPLEAYNLLTDVQHDYVAMVRKLNGVTKSIQPVDPWTLPLVERMIKARYDLALAAGIKPLPKR